MDADIPPHPDDFMLNEWFSFPAGLRKNAPSLYENCIQTILHHTSQICQNNNDLTPREVKEFRKYFRQRLPSHILTDLLDRILPSDPWSHPCAVAPLLVHCKMHWECRLTYTKLPMVIELLFSEDISHLNINLNKVDPNLHLRVLLSIMAMLTKLPRRNFPLLRSFVIRGMTHRSDYYITQIEEIVSELQQAASNLENLHLPTASNIVLGSVAQMKNLRAFRCDHSVNLSRRGISQLCRKDAASRTTLEVLHIGIYKHSRFVKEDASLLLRSLENLKEFSFLDERRCLLRVPWGEGGVGEKVFAYSTFKTAIKQHEKKTEEEKRKLKMNKERVEGEQEEENEGTSSSSLLATSLREITVVDRSLKPHYLLESAPQLQRLSIAWQEELCYELDRRFSRDWFSEMLKKPSWVILANKLTRLDISFPASYSCNTYGLPLRDYTELMKNLENLTSLRLVGAKTDEPFPLLPTLKYCPRLVELILEKTPIFVPACSDIFHPDFVNTNLRKFHFLDELASLGAHPTLTQSIGTYMPGLTELVLQPQSVNCYTGLKPAQLQKLSVLHELKKLSLPLSVQDCTSNMPEVIFVLRQFKTLRYLELSWGTVTDYHIVGRHNISFMMSWLYMALRSQNVDIHLTLSYKHNQEDYSNPVYFMC